ncbi:MAG: molybdate ABC transporter substrate-binding protein [Pirellulales bacterium]
MSSRPFSGGSLLSTPATRPLICAVAAALLLLPGCGGEAQQPSLLFYCAAGLRSPVAELADEFGRQRGVTVQCDYAGSEVLLSRVKLAQRGDLYMPGDASYMEQARREGLIASSRAVCYWVPVILVQKGNPKDIRKLADLARPGLRLGFGDAKACAIGRETVSLLKKNHLDPEQVNANVVFRSLTVNELGTNVKLGQLDAAIVWDAIASLYADQTEAIAIPVDENVISTVPIGVLSMSEQKDLAGQFIDFLTSPEGQACFRKHHYTTEIKSP